MKVLVLATTFPRWSNDSTASFVLDLCRGLASRGHEITVLAPHFPGALPKEKIDGVSVHRFRYFWPNRYQRLCYGGGILPNLRRNHVLLLQIPLLFFSQLFCALKLIRSTGIELIHAHWIIPCGITGAVCKSLSGCRLLITFHGSGDIFAVRRSYLKPVIKWVMRTADERTANSRSTARVIQESTGCTDNIMIIPMGVDAGITVTKFGNEAADNDFQSDEESPVVLSVGRLIDWKGIDYLIRAIALLDIRFSRVRLVICGDGPEKPGLERIVEELGLGERVSFEGYIPHDKLNDYYRTASVFVLPSIRIENTGETEGLGVVLLEAMSFGVPVIGSEIGGIPEIIEDGRNGFLSRPGDPGDIALKIEKVLSDSVLRETFSRNGLMTVESHFSWANVVRKFHDIYERLEKEPSPPVASNSGCQDEE